ncbi:armadillo repeat-containing protein 8-like isoform X3 [Bacillus rossius redtenbacheri]|uniref:armadillo repeat-containing protein 8-like isoform X3 n=1 Tax=Bacillus rossius redtenbacheri TaxID=93214 RepID=UPI002FDDD036
MLSLKWFSTLSLWKPNDIHMKVILINHCLKHRDVESSRSYIDELYSPDVEKCLQAIVCLKNSVIGSNRQKASVIAQGVVPRLLQLLSDDSLPDQVKMEATITLGSLAKGTRDSVRALVDLDVVPILIHGLGSKNMKLIEASLCCLRTIFEHQCAPVDLIYQNENLTVHLLTLTMHSMTNQVCVTTILKAACKTAENQNLLCGQGAVETLAALLCSPHYRVQMPTVLCLANMCYKNTEVSAEVATTSFGGKCIPDLLVGLMARDKPSEMQMAAAKCLTYLHRAKAISAEDPKIVFKTLPCLVRLCKKDHPCEQRVVAAETLAYLTEVDTELQRLASVSNHLVPALAEFLRHQPDPPLHPNHAAARLEEEVRVAQDLKQAAFKAFASLGANDEDIRKKIIDTDNLMDHIVNGLQDTNPKVRLAAVRCLHSLSRSVQQLRTTFQDHSVWRPLMQLLQGASDDILTVASSTLCNLLLEFSPSKEPILESGAVDLLCGLTRQKDPALRLNGIWALMNMAFQAEQKIKSQILNTLGTDQIFRLLSDPEVDVLMKTLGLLRNLLSTKPHIDHIMSLHGNQIMQAVVLILEGNHAAEVKEQALCILANIGDGDSAKEYIMSNEDVLKKLTDYMMHNSVKLQIAAIFCISNLVWREEPGAGERQAKLREIGVYKKLQSLLMANDTMLFDKVKTAMTQFSES